MEAEIMNQEKSIIITKVKIAKGKIKINYDKSREGFSESFYMESGEKAPLNSMMLFRLYPLM